MFDIEKHRREYHHELYTEIPGVLPGELCAKMVTRLSELIEERQILLVDHEGLGTDLELDAGGRYLHYLVDGPGIRRHFPELVAAYHCVKGLIAVVTSSDVVISPYPDSDINIKAYPPRGGTLGAHYDTNGITVLIYLTSNAEGPLRLEIEHHDPWKGTEMELPGSRVTRRILPVAGSMLVMQGRKVSHDSEAMENEFKAVAIFNFYEKGDTRRPGHFDNFVYRGEKQTV